MIRAARSFPLPACAAPCLKAGQITKLVAEETIHALDRSRHRRWHRWRQSVHADADLRGGLGRVVAAADRGFPCRISLEDARAGEELILLHHTSHDVETPYRSAYAIYVRPGVAAAAYRDAVPPVFEGRPIALRAFDAAGMLQTARLAGPGKADTAIRDLFAGVRERVSP